MRPTLIGFFLLFPWPLASSMTTLLPIARIFAKQGSISDQDKSVLLQLQQQGSQNNWNTYIEGYPSDATQRYIIQSEYTVPAGLVLSSISIATNTQGPLKSHQQRKFQIRNQVTKKWEDLGDNAGCPDWNWCFQEFEIVANANNYIKTNNNRIQIRLRSNNNWDDVNIDYLVMEVTSGSPPETPAPIVPPSPAPVTASTPAPVGAPTPAPVVSPTFAPVTPPTPAPVASTPSPVAPIDPSSWWMPKSSDALTWQWQIQGTIDTSLNVDMYDIDLFDTPVSTIQFLQSQGKKVVCYFSAGSYEGWRPDWADSFDFITGTSYSGNQPPFAGQMSVSS